MINIPLNYFAMKKRILLTSSFKNICHIKAKNFSKFIKSAPNTHIFLILQCTGCFYAEVKGKDVLLDGNMQYVFCKIPNDRNCIP